MSDKEELGICPEPEDCVSDSELPTAVEMAKNLLRDGGKILSNAIKGNSTLVEDGVRFKRWETCLGCPLLKDERCTECGCFMKVKVAFVTSKCPIGKW